MFTLGQIKSRHAEVRSGADFPAFASDLKKMGVEKYETYVSDGHSIYHGADDFQLNSGAKYDLLLVAQHADGDAFKENLVRHQQGQSDYAAFCKQSAEAGIQKWVVDLNDMTCTYFDMSGHVIHTERIPSV